jgi:lipopolysaccharide export system protein LptA
MTGHSVTKTLYLFLGLFFSVANAQDSAETERLELVHADTLFGTVINRQQVQRLVGDVKFRQGDAIMTCDQAIYYMANETVVFMGHVHVVADQKEIFADRMEYDSDTQVQVATGDVTLVDSSNTLTCEWMTFKRLEDQAIARQNVVITDHEQDFKLTGSEVVYDLEKAYAQVIGKPMFTSMDSLGMPDLTIEGEVIEMFSDGDTVQVSNQVVIERNEMVATCRYLKYIRELDIVHLLDEPVVRQGDDFIIGETIDILMDGTEIAGMEVRGRSFVATRVDTQKTSDNRFNLISGQRVSIGIREQEVDSVAVTGQATSYFYVIENGAERGINKIIGDKLVIYFQNGELERVWVKGDPSPSEGTFYPVDSFSIKRIEQEMAETLSQMRGKISGRDWISDANFSEPAKE